MEEKEYKKIIFNKLIVCMNEIGEIMLLVHEEYKLKNLSQVSIHLSIFARDIAGIENENLLEEKEFLFKRMRMF